MAVKLLQPGTIPPGGYRFVERGTNFEVKAHSFTQLVRAVAAHKRANNLPVTGQLDQEIQEQLCSHLPPGWCEYNDPFWNPGRGGSLNFNDVVLGTKILVDWFLSGKKRVEKSEADRRASICSGCPQNQLPIGCNSCNLNVLRGVVESIVGGKITTHDHLLNACGICGCSLKAKVWLPLELLKKHEPEGRQYPDWCWLNTPKPVPEPEMEVANGS